MKKNGKAGNTPSYSGLVLNPNPQNQGAQSGNRVAAGALNPQQQYNYARTQLIQAQNNLANYSQQFQAVQNQIAQAKQLNTTSQQQYNFAHQQANIAQQNYNVAQQYNNKQGMYNAMQQYNAAQSSISMAQQNLNISEKSFSTANTQLQAIQTQGAYAQQSLQQAQYNLNVATQQLQNFNQQLSQQTQLSHNQEFNAEEYVQKIIDINTPTNIKGVKFRNAGPDKTYYNSAAVEAIRSLKEGTMRSDQCKEVLEYCFSKGLDVKSIFQFHEIITPQLVHMMFGCINSWKDMVTTTEQVEAIKLALSKVDSNHIIGMGKNALDDAKNQILRAIEIEAEEQEEATVEASEEAFNPRAYVENRINEFGLSGGDDKYTEIATFAVNNNLTEDQLLAVFTYCFERGAIPHNVLAQCSHNTKAIEPMLKCFELWKHTITTSTQALEILNMLKEFTEQNFDDAVVRLLDSVMSKVEFAANNIDEDVASDVVEDHSVIELGGESTTDIDIHD